jgi:hypothetical protein
MARFCRQRRDDVAVGGSDPIDATLAGVGGTRVEWAAVPEPVRRSIELRLGSPVSEAASQVSGFSPGLAARLRLADGRRVFVKAIAPDEESGAPGGQDAYRREARITAALPRDVAAPRLIDSWDASGWVVLALENIDGVNPDLPWKPDQLSRVLETITETAQRLTPSPIAAPRAGSAGGEGHWASLAADPERLERLSDIEPWAAANLAGLIELEGRCESAGRGETLLHTDIRADNIVMTDERVYLVDWPHAEIGAAWVDLVWFLPSVGMQGGPPPRNVFRSHPLAGGADRSDVAAVLAACAGFMIEGATRPPPPGLPNLRVFQLHQGLQATAWLRQTIT